MNDSPFMYNPAAFRQENENYAKEGAENGNYVIGLGYNNGIVFLSHNDYVGEENYKINEVHNNIALVGSGRLSDTVKMKEKAILEADVTELRYSAQDVHAKELANSVLGPFAENQLLMAHPLQAVFLLGDVGTSKNMFYKIIFDGKIIPCENFASIGGKLSDDYENWIENNCFEKYKKETTLADAILFGVDCLSKAYEQRYAERLKSEKISAFEEILQNGDSIEIAVLDRKIIDTSKFAPISETRLKHELAPFKPKELEDLLKRYEIK